MRKYEPEEVAKMKEKKQDVWAKLQVILSGCILLLLLALVIGALAGLSTLHQSLKLIEEDVQQLKMEEVNGAVASLTNAADQLSEVDVNALNRTALSLKDAAETLSAVDVDEINTSVKALTNAANNLSKLDIEQLNSLITSLNTVAERLQSVTSILSRLTGGS